MDNLFAHSLPGAPIEDWERLGDHLTDVAELAARFAGKFGAEPWGKAAGLLHDIGKSSTEFQQLIRGGTARVDHSTAGARFAIEQYRTAGRLLAYVIAGHHTGLANGTGNAPVNPRAPLQHRLDPQAYPIPTINQSDLPPGLPDRLPVPSLTNRADLTGSLDRKGFGLAFFTRMVFSALVDADRLATEAFYRKAAGHDQADRGHWRSLGDLKVRVDTHMREKAERARVAVQSDGQRRVNAERARILEAARQAAVLPQGLFSLTVPTGGGKTLASLSFALDHAVKHGLDRIIYVIPFTSIIEQTARVFRDALGPDCADQVLEHHSAFREDVALASIEAASGGESTLQSGERLRFATENWDAPIIVTTAVQFFESLFANRPSRCRKLHNIAKSIVIFDEAQTLPLKLLKPTLAAIDELALHYRTTAVLCTATQPAVAAKRSDGLAGLPGGLGPMREIIEKPQRLYASLTRVSVKPSMKVTEAELVTGLAARGQVLCIVGTRSQARDLFKQLRGCTDAGTTFHLSALMCPAHRTEKLAEIRASLARGATRVVATTVVEAGVDIDFPAVWRQMAGLDSIAQAAGRCNREGRMSKEEAVVQLFEVEGWHSIQELRPNEDAARDTLRRNFDDILGLDAMAYYFDRLYRQAAIGQQDKLDDKRILQALNESAHLGWLPFATIADDYRIIDSVMEPVIVPWGLDGKAAANALADPSLPSEMIGAAARRLQPYIVNVPKAAFFKLRQVGRIAPINPGRFDEQFTCLGVEAKDNIYSDDLGLDWSDETFRSAESNLM